MQNNLEEKQKHFLENPYDLNTVLEAMEIAKQANNELLFLDKFIAYLRLDPTAELTAFTFTLLRTMDLI